MNGTTQLHASCVSIEGKGVLLLGQSGSGKSDLALRLIDGGAVLVADDRVDIARGNERLTASPPPSLRGMIEARGIGILRLPYAENAPLTLAIELVARHAIERLPEPKVFDCLGIKLPLHCLHAFDGAICAKIRLLLEYGV